MNVDIETVRGEVSCSMALAARAADRQDWTLARAHLASVQVNLDRCVRAVNERTARPAPLLTDGPR